ncbi:MAG TPA: glycosyltransferase [Cyclobacteriaceae bacterium]
MNSSLPKRILITALDWGLGHATRCIPIIRALKKRNTEVFIASSGRALILLREEFPELTNFELIPYNIHYSRSLPFSVSLSLQIPKFLNAIKKEHDQVNQIVQDYKIDLIISDNRFGCWSAKVPSVFVTHQVNLQMPRLLKWAEPLISRLNKNWIKKFSYCWIPDEPENPITGKLSSTQNLDTRYIGMLSRFRSIDDVNKKHDLLILLSGPEPQRSVLEEKLIKQLNKFEGKIYFVRGLPGGAILPDHENANLIIKNHLPSDELNRVIEESETIICRSGYSTVMDMSRLAKKVIFIPTPGQTEQEYLADELSIRKIALYINQDIFQLKQALEFSKAYTGFPKSVEDDLLEKALNQLRI